MKPVGGFLGALLLQAVTLSGQVIPGSFACSPGECLSISSGRQYFHVLYVTASCEQGRNINASAFVRVGTPNACLLTVYSMISGTIIQGEVFSNEIGIDAYAEAGFAPPFPVTFRNFQSCNSGSSVSVGGGSFPC